MINTVYRGKKIICLSLYNDGFLILNLHKMKEILFGILVTFAVESREDFHAEHYSVVTPGIERSENASKYFLLYLNY